MPKADNLNQYALYRGDEFITLGTIEEIATFMNIAKSTIRVLRTNKYLRKIKNYHKCYRLIKLERNDE